ncbi:MAG: PASTA domain-containing protein [Rubrobacter sp.]|nr:PASTA domain-containing protein [Rubrobacter sp.]
MAALTKGQYVLGATKYMSPEQAHGKPATSRSDLYSLGVVLYEMLTGEAPYDADTPLGVAVKHASEPPPIPRETNPDVPEPLSDLTLWLLAKDPENRPESASNFVEALKEARRKLSPVAGAGAAGMAAAGMVPVGSAAAGEIPNGAPDGTSGRRGMGPPPGASDAAAPGAAGGTARNGRKRLLWVALAALLIAALVAVGPLVSDLLPGVANRLEAVVGGGAEPVKVPDVKGLPEDEAGKKLSGAGFGVEKETRESVPENEGKVLDQSVASGGTADEGSKISLVVGGGPPTVEVPDLYYLKFPEAQQKLEDLGLKVGEKKIIHDHQYEYEKYPKEVVLKQTPASGEEAEAGTEIDLQVACNCDAGDHTEEY